MKTSSKKQKTAISFDLEFDAKDFEPARLKALERLAGKVKIPGFRNGKAPANIIEQHVDPNELASLTLDILVRTTIPKLFTDAKVTPVSAPNVDIKKYVPGEMAELTLTADILPEVKLGDYKKLEAVYYERPVTDDDVKDVLGRIVAQMAEPKVVKRAAKDNDEVIIDFVGKKDDKAFEGGSAKDFHLKIGSKQFIPGFEDGLIGHEVGDKFDLPLKFPEDYGNAELAGADVVFEILLKQVNEMVTPKLDDELAKKVGSFKTLDELKKDIRKNLEAQYERDSKEHYKDSLIAELVSKSKTEAPESLINEQAENIKKDNERNLKSRGMTLKDYLKQQKQPEADYEKELKKAAEQRIIGSLVVQSLADELKITVGDDVVKSQLDAMRENYKNSAEALAQLNQPEAENSVRNHLRIEQTLDKLAELNRKHAKVEKAAPVAAKKPKTSKKK
ncbi:trigger factor [Candidatus Saccharibacteria bacterium]|nr:trigger factor [Candidatus Saccharibacteria bacterium]